MKLPYSFILATSSYQAAEDEGSAFGGPVSLNIFCAFFLAMVMDLQLHFLTVVF